MNQSNSINNHSKQNGVQHSRAIQVETFNSFQVNQKQDFFLYLEKSQHQSNLVVTISNPTLGSIDTSINWLEQNQFNQKCKVSFNASVVGIYTINLELINNPQANVQFYAKAYDLNKVFIYNSTGQCHVNESYEFTVDASEAGEGQLEIAVNEGEIPNQVQVLDNGKCIVNFVPEDSVPHVVDIKFNGYNVNGCPFVVKVLPSESTQQHQKSQLEPINESTHILPDASQIAPSNPQTITAPLGPPTLVKDERILVNTNAIFSLENLTQPLEPFDKRDLFIIDPEGVPVNYKLTTNSETRSYTFEVAPLVVGDYTVALRQKSDLYQKLPANIVEQFPFPLKVFNYGKVIVSDVTDGVVGHPIFFFIDATQAGSGNLEIRVSSKTRFVPNHHHSEAINRIRVNFTPTEAVDHTIDVKFNGIPVPGNPILVKVAQFPQARLPIASQDILKSVAINELVEFHVDYIGTRENGNLPLELLSEKCCQVHVLSPDFVYTRLNSIEMINKSKSSSTDTSHISSNSSKTNTIKSFKIAFRPTKIGPYKLFISVNNELLPSSPIVSNVYDINEVKVFFGTSMDPSTTKTSTMNSNHHQKPIGYLNKSVTFTVDASRAGEGILALTVESGLSKNSVKTDLKVSEQSHGLYNLTFVPTEFAPHSIEMSFNDRVLQNSPFIVDILDENGKSSFLETATAPNIAASEPSVLNTNPIHASQHIKKQQEEDMVQTFESLSLKRGNAGSNSIKPKSTTKKSLAFGLVNASNVVYLEAGVLDNNKNQVELIGPSNEKVPFVLGKGAPQRSEPKRTYIEYKPQAIGTHTINVLENGKDLRQYYVETCDPSLTQVIGLNESGSDYTVGKPVSFTIDATQSGDIQLDSVAILSPSSSSQKQESHHSNLLGRLTKSSKHSSSSASISTQSEPLEYSISRLDERRHLIRFVPLVCGKHTIDIRCLGQPVGQSPYSIQVTKGSTNGSAEIASAINNKIAAKPNTKLNGLNQDSSSGISSSNGTSNGKRNVTQQQLQPNQHHDHILHNIVVHGISLKSTPVNSIGAFIIETNRFARAKDFDVLIADPDNKLVDVQCYLQEDGNLLAKWTPRRVGPHKIEVSFQDQPVPGSPFVAEAFDPEAVIFEPLKQQQQNGTYLLDERISFRLCRHQAGHGELEVAITSPNGESLPVELEPEVDTELANAKELTDNANTSGQDDNNNHKPASGSSRKAALKAEIMSFMPTIPGKYKVSVLFCGYEVPKSPVVLTVRDNNSGSATNTSNGTNIDYLTTCGDIPPQVSISGAGLRCAEVNRTAQFLLDTNKPLKTHKALQQLLKVRIECGQREIVPQIELAPGSTGLIVKYKPTEVGYANICLYWNGSHVDGSPFSVPINDLTKMVLLKQHGKPMNGVESQTLVYVPNQPIQFSMDTTYCGPGELTAEAYCRANPDIKFNLPVSQVMSKSKSLYNFEFVCPPKQAQLAKGWTLSDVSLRATYVVRFYYNNLSVAESLVSILISPPSDGQQTHQLKPGHVKQQVAAVAQQLSSNRRERTNLEQSSNKLERSVLLEGSGLVEASVGELAEFVIDGTQAPSGKPDVTLTPVSNGYDDAPPSSSSSIKVYLEPAGERAYRASYVAHTAGLYSLNVYWSSRLVAGCPFSIQISSNGCDPSKVVCTGDGLKGGVLGEEIKVFIDTRRAGPGELTAICDGPQKVAFCELLDRNDGTFILYIKPQESGRQLLTIKYAGQHIPKSPFVIKVSGKPDSSKVRVHGPGVEHGVLPLYQSRFVCDTRGAGAGQLTVRIRGPKGAFRMETQRESQRDRTILCKYDPTEPGDYRIEIKWSGQHVPGSPFSVMIFDTQEELNRFLYRANPNNRIY